MKTTKDNSKLFSEFGPTDLGQWKQKVIVDLKGKDFERELTWHNINNIDIESYYDQSSSAIGLENTGNVSQHLANYRRIVVQSDSIANKQALKAIQEGCNALIFDLTEKSCAYDLLEDIDISSVELVFILRKKEIEFANEFFLLVKESKIKPTQLKGYFDLDAIYDYFISGIVDCSKLDKIVELSKLAVNYPNFKSISLSGRIFLDSGSNQVQELAYTLNSLVFLVEKFTNRGMELKDIFNNLHIELAISTDYFVEIAKFRAFRHLLNLISKAYNIDNPSYNLSAKTSIWDKSVMDAHSNLLRASSEAMSAILGTVDGIEIDPLDSQINGAQSNYSRIASNIGNILLEEAYLNKVNNPVDGSYYIENLTAKIAAKALELFKIIEGSGGLYKAFEDERIQKQIAEIRFKKLNELSKRRQSIVGVNKYANKIEKLDIGLLNNKEIIENKVEKCLKPRRASLEFEYLRFKTESFKNIIGRVPVVELAMFGNKTMSRARASFSRDFLEIAGFVVVEQYYSSSLTAAQTSAQNEVDLVVMCSSDEDYQNEAVNFTSEFRKNNTNKVLILAGNPVELKDDLHNKGLDYFINLKSDVLEINFRILKSIESSTKAMEI